MRRHGGPLTNKSDDSDLDSDIFSTCNSRIISKMATTTTAASRPSQNITLPFISELYDDNFLDVLLPPSVSPKSESESSTVKPVQNAMIDALQATAHHALTENNAMAYDSTLNATLDAFQGLTRYVFSSQVDAYLAKSWDENKDLTLRIIWNSRSIHDGKGENELFYR
jgi:hypothetical protein